MDVLTDLLQRSRARGAAFSRSTLHGQWGLRFPVNGALAIHAIVDGEMYAWTDDPGRPIRVAGGDVLLLRASPHHLASAPGLPTVAFQDLIGPALVARRATLGRPSDGPAADFCCGAYLFDGDLSTPLLDSLPDLVRLRPAAGSPLRVTVDLLAAEMVGEGPGQQALLDRLLDVTLVQSLRAWFAQTEQVPGWFRALDDPSLGTALRAIHADPAHPWTVAELARLTSQSRSSFARRFTEVVGTPPLQYLTDWRIALARERLRDTRDPLSAIAAEVGYASEFSFASAFKRRTGTSPGRWRAQQAS
ncbi:MAG: AraC family transcriptional regulator [Acidobacteriota bacterium]|nr:AraC family transcriptional regulator [Acidobacteriota bacterium]